MSVSDLPTLNAFLNGLASVFLITGFVFIRRKMIPQHRAMMLAAFVTSGLFLISYLTYHFSAHLITRFQGEGLARTVYFAILISHSALAVAVPPMAIITLFRGLKMNVEKHRALARWTLPIWLYVSVTGVAVYFMLYHIYA
ncbi:MAG: DUF420 domain-containing protein [Bacteroidetes bacterium]|nr:DUF420 domain-containing protein [Bacteroidota bacterium]